MRARVSLAIFYGPFRSKRPMSKTLATRKSRAEGRAIDSRDGIAGLDGLDLLLGAAKVPDLAQGAAVV